MITDQERWLPIVDFEGLYEVSDIGRVRSVPKRNTLGHRVRPKILTNARPASNGYPTIRLRRDGQIHQRAVHLLVLAAFRGPCPPGMEACHEDGTRTNYRLDNLRWDTPSANNREKIRHGTHQGGEKNGRARLTAEQVLTIRRRYADLRRGRGKVPNGVVAAMAAEYGVTTGAIRDIATHRVWKHLPDAPETWMTPTARA